MQFIIRRKKYGRRYKQVERHGFSIAIRSAVPVDRFSLPDDRNAYLTPTNFHSPGPCPPCYKHLKEL
ncbi:MAG: hypothetical protein LZF61_11165 [Nitrosomonas sp.]|nr:MAG: hypothetical protein LZF61_11165 [Nitrosomonas sp.]